MKALAALIALAALACSGEPPAPSGTISTEAAQALILQRDDARDAAAARERELLGEIEQLRAENNDLRSQLGLAQETAEEAAARAEQYQAGLGKAVAKLNEVSQEATDAQRLVAANRAAAASSQTNDRARPDSAANLSYFTTPQLSIVENSIMASGQFYNSGSAPARGTLFLDLVRNGEVIYTAEQRIIANQKSWGTWQQEFHATSNGAQVSVVPRFEAE